MLTNRSDQADLTPPVLSAPIAGWAATHFFDLRNQVKAYTQGIQNRAEWGIARG